MTETQYQRRLQAIHAQCASLMVSIETMLADCAEPAQSLDNACPHAPEFREKISTLADVGLKYRCRKCGQENV